MPTALELLRDPVHGLVREQRDPQLKMASTIDDVVKNGGIYVVEAPVGTGKTLAYLTPALMAAGKRIVVATAKKSLQDQIELKDLPSIANVLGIVEGRAHTLTTNATGQTCYLSRVVKGKSNYACRMLAEKHSPSAEYLDWLAESRFGDRADYPGAVPPWWNHASAEGCVGRACSRYENCGYIKLKQSVQQSRIVVVNHHLLGADVFCGHGTMVGGPYDVLIIDEAHKLADGVRKAFTYEVSEEAIADIVKRLSETPFAFTQHRALGAVWKDLFDELPNKHWRELHTRDVPVFPAHSESAVAALANLDNEMARLFKSYGISGHPSDADFWIGFAEALQDYDDAMKGDLVEVATVRRQIDGMSRGINIMQGRACSPKEGEEEEEYLARNERLLANTVIYGNANSKGFKLYAAPVQIGGIIGPYLEKAKAAVITSATLAVDGSFEHLDDTIGVRPSYTDILDSPFNYDRQGFAFIPRDVPVVKRESAEYGESVRRRIQYCVDLVNLSQGGAFILTTANDELDYITEALREQVQYPVFAQGHFKNPWDGDPQSVLRKFHATPNAVVVGSKSFWEGVDVPGEKLRLVILAKLPFPSPNDPYVKARTSRYADGYEGWMKVSYVDMMIDLRQGVGRLIRSKSDLGVVAVLDSRIWEKPYGRRIRHAIKFPITDKMDDCRKEIPRIVAALRRRAAQTP